MKVRCSVVITHGSTLGVRGEGGRHSREDMWQTDLTQLKMHSKPALYTAAIHMLVQKQWHVIVRLVMIAAGVVN